MQASWDRCRAWIVAALETCPTHGIEDVEAGIKSGKFQCWAGPNCVSVTEVCEYPKLKALHHWLSGGDLRELIEQGKELEAWAKARGCTLMFGTSKDRPAFRRVMERQGYSVGQLEYFKDLT
jgi:hypothetical protein